jgi:hypothetical protein
MFSYAAMPVPAAIAAAIAWFALQRRAAVAARASRLEVFVKG